MAFREQVLKIPEAIYSYSLRNVYIAEIYYLCGSFSYCSLLFLIGRLMMLDQTLLKETGQGYRRGTFSDERQY